MSDNLSDNLLISHEGAIAIIAINRPQSLNALDAPTFHQLSAALEKLEGNEQVRVIILTGQGDKAFVAGADISYMKGFGPLEGKEFALLGQRVMNQLEKLSKPVIGAINGYALGGGCELAMACDIRIASEKAKFGQPEVNLGVLPGFAGSQRLPRLVGKGMAKELLLTGRVVAAQEAKEIGLVNRVVAPEDLMATAKEMANLIAQKGPIAVSLIKEAVDQGLEMDADKGMAFEANLFGVCFGTQDQKEGMSAFLEKRPPQFQGR